MACLLGDASRVCGVRDDDTHRGAHRRVTLLAIAAVGAVCAGGCGAAVAVHGDGLGLAALVVFAAVAGVGWCLARRIDGDGDSGGAVTVTRALRALVAAAAIGIAIWDVRSAAGMLPRAWPVLLVLTNLLAASGAHHARMYTVCFAATLLWVVFMDIEAIVRWGLFDVAGAPPAAAARSVCECDAPPCALGRGGGDFNGGLTMFVALPCLLLQAVAHARAARERAAVTAITLKIAEAMGSLELGAASETLTSRIPDLGEDLAGMFALIIEELVDLRAYVPKHQLDHPRATSFTHTEESRWSVSSGAAVTVENPTSICTGRGSLGLSSMGIISPPLSTICAGGADMSPATTVTSPIPAGAGGGARKSPRTKDSTTTARPSLPTSAMTLLPLGECTPVLGGSTVCSESSASNTIPMTPRARRGLSDRRGVDLVKTVPISPHCSPNASTALECVPMTPAPLAHRTPSMCLSTRARARDQHVRRENVTLVAINMHDSLTLISENAMQFRRRHEATLQVILYHAGVEGIVDRVVGDRTYLSFNASKRCISHALSGARTALKVAQTAGAVTCVATTGPAVCGGIGCAEMRCFAVLGPLPIILDSVLRLATRWGYRTVCNNITRQEVWYKYSTRAILHSVTMRKHTQADADDCLLYELPFPAGSEPVATNPADEVLSPKTLCRRFSDTERNRKDQNSERGRGPQEWMYAMKESDSDKWDTWNKAARQVISGNLQQGRSTMDVHEQDEEVKALFHERTRDMQTVELVL